MTDTLQSSDTQHGERRRRPTRQVSDSTEPSIAIVRENLYAVLSIRETMGFVERVDRVFVALHGPDLARAVEVGQSLSWDECVAMVRDAHHA